MSFGVVLQTLDQCIAGELEPTVALLTHMGVQLRAAVALERETARELATAQAEAIVHSAMLLSELEDAREALNRTAREVEVASRAKSAFVANMSHELRTPLNAIIGYSEMLREDADAAGRVDLVTDLERITSSGRHLLALINDVLDFSKIEAGQMTFEVREFDAAVLVDQVTVACARQAAQGGNTLVATVDPATATLCQDPAKLRQVLLHLVGNACKFTHQGRIDLRVAPDADVPSWFVVEVSDSGIGMGPEELARLFGDFSQGDPSTTRRYGGTGLGLAICKRLCDLMGGSIGVRSTPGVGSTFVVRLPHRCGAAAPVEMPADVTAPEQDAAACTDTHRVIVLISDRTDAVADAAARLTRAGHTVNVLPPVEAAARVQQAMPALVVLDTASDTAALAALRGDAVLAQAAVLHLPLSGGARRSALTNEQMRQSTGFLLLAGKVAGVLGQ